MTDRYTPPSAREEAAWEAMESAHEAECAEAAIEILSTPESAVEVICDALGLVYDDKALTHADGPFLLAVAAIYADAMTSYNESPLARTLCDVLDKSLDRVIQDRIEEKRRDYRSAA